MLPSRSRSLKLHLAAFIFLAAAIPVVLAGGFAFFHLAGETVDEIQRRNLTLARSVAGEVEALLRSPRYVLANIGELLRHSRGPDAAHQPAAVLASHFPEAGPGAVGAVFDSIYLLDGAGTVVAVGLPAAEQFRRDTLLGLDLSHKGFFRRALAEGAPAWSPTFLSLIGGRVSVALARPVDGIGVLVGNLNLDLLQDLLARHGAADSIAMALVDRDGAVVAHTDPEIAARRVNLHNLTPVREALAGRAVTREYPDATGATTLGSAAPVAGPGWAALVSQPAAAAYAPIRHAAALAGGVGVAVLALAVWLAVAVARRYAEPLALLTEQARGAAGGRYRFPEVRGPYREVELLGRTFAEMLGALATRERELAESERRFRELADLLPQVVFEMDPAGTLTYANRFGLDLFDVAPSELQQGLAVSELLAPEDRDRGRENIGRRLRGEPVADNEYHMRTRDGRTVRMLISSAPIIRDGEVRGLRGVMIDITERRALEVQVRQSQKMEAVGTLASGIAHDFNNLLQAISGYTELLQLDLQDEGARARLAQIATATTRATELVQQILAFSRSRTPDRRPIDLNREVRSAAAMLRRVVPKMIRIEEHLAPDLWPLRADPVQVEQVLMNLGSNARDAMPEGGTLRLRTRNRVLAEGELPPLAPGPHVELTVADDGCGIEAAVAERIFEPFFTTKDVGKGTGLGLSTAFGIVKAHGGELRCESAPGHGTRFTVTLPAEPGAVADTAEDAETPLTARAAGERVLVADDEAMVRELAAAALGECGYRVECAPDGETALELYRRALGPDGAGPAFAAVVLDLGMPGMGGRRCLDELRRLDPAARVLVASGYGEASLPSDLRAAGAARFVPKPYRLTELCEAVRDVLNEPAPTPTDS